MITQDGNQIGAIGLFSIDPRANLDRYGNSGVTPDKPATPVLDFVTNGVTQGFVEGQQRQSRDGNDEADRRSRAPSTAINAAMESTENAQQTQSRRWATEHERACRT